MMDEPVVVPDEMSSTEANAAYGECYGVDWSYTGAITEFGGVLRPESERFATYRAFIAAGFSDAEAREMGWPSEPHDAQRSRYVNGGCVDPRCKDACIHCGAGDCEPCLEGCDGPKEPARKVTDDGV